MQDLLELYLDPIYQDQLSPFALGMYPALFFDSQIFCVKIRSHRLVVVGRSETSHELAGLDYDFAVSGLPPVFSLYFVLLEIFVLVLWRLVFVFIY